VKNYKPDRLVKDHHGARDISILLRPPEAREGPEIMFLKRMWRVRAKDGIKSLLRTGKVQSVARQEWINCCALEAAKIPTPQLIAMGEEIGLLSERFSFIITAAAAGHALEDFLKQTLRRDVRRTETLKSLARLVRRMHDRGLFLPDLFNRHIFVENPGAEARFQFIDNARLTIRRSTPLRLRARDLAALHVSTPMADASATERLRFLSTYGDAPTLIPKIRKRAVYLLKRPKFKTFYAKPDV
jgi:tRNA A-37 threonylcarbamoyl transferase component Bud32